ncbi:DUF2510 domain-containing protein [Agromyces archimandritae]|uniref:DUF2510 domain-containing protein n=1 Tax=Agromyces archimandritae TaxID=2781962 RepID=A0A975IR14_9MICO|nr:DUF2510 domain-containing protein [Agromyces archimandritae]QTX05616.1 DUF2510 domain-containing protein [Agromyces archimandritae]
MGENTNTGTPAGWYDDGSGRQRYWDGAQWTDRFADAGAPVPPYAPPSTGRSGDSGPKWNVLAFVALGFAVVGFIFACMPGALIVGWVLLPVAFILAIVAFFLKGKKWPAIVALILAVVGTIVGFIVFVSSAASSFDDSFGGGDVTVTPPASAHETHDAEDGSSAQAGTRDNPVPLGATISGDDYDVVVNGVDRSRSDEIVAENTFNEEPAEGSRYVLVNLTVTYTGDESGSTSSVRVRYATGAGNVIDEEIFMTFGGELEPQDLLPGGGATGDMAFLVPVDDDGGLVMIRPGFLADDVFVATE